MTAVTGHEALNGVTPRWEAGYWDGVVSGFAEYGGRLAWFHVVAYDVEREPPPLQCLLYELTDSEAAMERRRHNLFRKHVGTHTDYGATGLRRGKVRPRAEWRHFYDSGLGRQPSYEDHRVLGWFMLDPDQGRRRPPSSRRTRSS